MAPSRALLRCVASAQRRSTPHLHAVASCTTQRTLRSLPTRHNPLISRHVSSPPQLPIVQSYSQSHSPSHDQLPEPPDHLSEMELHVFNKIRAEFAPIKLEVQDISGGCGSMFALEIESSRFKGLTVIKQHKLVNSILAEEIKGWHGVQLRTKAA